MGRRNGTGKSAREESESFAPQLHPDVKKSIVGLLLVAASAIVTLAWVGKAGPAGMWLHAGGVALFGWGYVLLPVSLLGCGLLLLVSHQKNIALNLPIGAVLFVLSALGIITIASPGNGGYLGKILGSFEIPFGATAAVIVNAVFAGIGFIVSTNSPLKIRLPEWNRERDIAVSGESIEENDDEETPQTPEKPEEKKTIVTTTKETAPEEDDVIIAQANPSKAKAKGVFKPPQNYVPPPLTLLKSTVEKPTTGDLRANANIIKRTLDSFGIPVEMGEINIGPKVTRYTLKPAEGVKLSRITALSQDLSLALAAHPIRIEAPIPGKSFVGIEVPNKSAAIVRLGSLMSYPDFQASGPLGIVLGRDVNGEPVFARIDKMPHMLVAGATGSGKSILVHSIITSLLYKNSPAMLKLLMIDPKRVELSLYDGLPHLAAPVITENKKAVNVFRWAIKEMEQRYETLAGSGKRDIGSYNSANPEEALPYVVIVVDEMADLMSSYGREVEGSIIRLAQMARATGIHLLLSTQRPSVEIITGLIKANITNRIALQVASQIDSRTILDSSGAEKLLGGGDLLYIAPDISKPKRIQGAYLSEEELTSVAEFIRENNKPDYEAAPQLALDEKVNEGAGGLDLDGSLEDDDDELYDEAVNVVREAKKASASLLQRRLKVGYARAARLLDLMEGNGLIGPGEGAKPRDVFVDEQEI